jgi:hypothetical protein
VLITTNEEAENILITKVYPVYDLIAPKPSYRFEGVFIPGMTSGGIGGGVMGGVGMMGGGMMGGGMGGMGGGMSSGMGGMGGGMYSVADSPGSASVGHDAGVNVLPQMAAPTPAAGGAAPPNPFGGAPTKDGNAAASKSKGHRGQGGMSWSGGSPGPGGLGSDAQPDFDSLIDLITSTIKPTTWDNVGGPGSIVPAHGVGALVVSQTQAVHEEIEALLANLRAASPGLRVVAIRAVWLQLDLKQFDQLMHSKPGQERGIDRRALYEMARKTKGYLGAITCLSGQTVHVASGRSRTAITGAVPVVGDALGYQPMVSQPQAGALLQITPQLLPNTQGAMLDLCSSVTRAADKPETVRFYSDDPRGGKNGDKNAPTRGLTLDRVNMVVSQLATTVKVPLNEPTLVGGLTTEAPDGDEQAAEVPQLYLFIEASAK